ncbi:hypothetical protein EN836_26960 [Mesorhizobium sp. M1C.F.Ca.ET.193.01.1.1]|nr:hypothetical protein EN853_26955 [Mesorhizobium sp. M1C.F.Ca.ET.210.01.1.1]TGQ66287.1 hypothetical protein EN855_026965 [Mesorhizobium sp. M1C.F.Ca.ET.212.01.1.1]TGR00311.1 hypothetical protein EN847_26955 [Mesorhizobium sp. M1C.F.Ca.ET.204.01.1.1]TGR20970.1 hypothetical protein EN839_26955 [Mesorhizobium sp. M1C.F.Ca.ET.196.01.1.1]TGR43385.1 hypothetical protein EN838_26955 [Mesorhizobium sp. M1C.F.Ca.ET.195.01.1.1]TGR61811.1 hypothetical protein EN835_026950 [Mesorhizobium sp. M1C.F.Ca.ET
MLKIGSGGLDLIYSAGEEREFDGLDEAAFCDVAVSLYLFHELHHITQKLIAFSDVQKLKRTAGLNKLGEMDLIADAVAAQIFAASNSVDMDGGRLAYARSFLGALRFMIRFCFPAFGFPLDRKHKVQRAFGIVLMALSTERAIKSGELATAFDAPLFPYFSDDFSELAVLVYNGVPTMSVVQFAASLRPESVVDLLGFVDSGDVAAILQKARELV